MSANPEEELEDDVYIPAPQPDLFADSDDEELEQQAAPPAEPAQPPQQQQQQLQPQQADVKANLAALAARRKQEVCVCVCVCPARCAHPRAPGSLHAALRAA